MRQAGKSRFDLGVSGSVQDIDVKAETGGGGLQVAVERRGQRRSRIEQREIMRGVRCQFAQHPEPLGGNIGVDRGDAGDVAAGPVEAGDKAEFDRIAAGGEHHRNGSGGVLGRHRGGGAAGGGDQRHLAADQLGGEVRQPLVVPVGPAIVDGDVVAVDETGLAQAFEKRIEAALVLLRRTGMQKPDHRQRRLLRPRGPWPGEH